MSSESRMSFWEFLEINKKPILKIVVAVAVIVAYNYIDKNYHDEFHDFIEEYWPILISFPLGYILGNQVAKRLYIPVRRLLILMDVETHTIRPIMVPEEVFRQMDQSGNNIGYHTAYGTPTYIVKDVDFSTGKIDYGWVHELNALVVMTREDAYVKWDDTLNEVLAENLQLMHHPQVIGLGYARDSLRDHLDSFSEALGFKRPDFEAHDPAGTPVPEEPPGEQEVSDAPE